MLCKMPLNWLTSEDGGEVFPPTCVLFSRSSLIAILALLTFLYGRLYICCPFKTKKALCYWLWSLLPSPSWFCPLFRCLDFVSAANPLLLPGVLLISCANSWLDNPWKVFQSGLRIIPFELANDAQNLLCDIVQFSGLEKHLLKTTPCCCLGSLLPNLHSPPPDSESKILQKWSCGSWKFSLHWLGNECLFSGLHQAFGGLATAALPLCCTFVLFL